MSMMSLLPKSIAHYLIFGDLHGRILPAFRLAMRWEWEHGVRLDGLLQVGDLGYFPDTGRLDKATARHAAVDHLELGTSLVVEPNREADEVSHEGDGPPPTLWFTAGNHEDFDALAKLEGGGRRSSSFAVDAYGFVRCVRDGRVDTLPGSLRVGAVWSIDDKAPNARRRTHWRGRIRDRSLSALTGTAFDVLISHDSPKDAVLADSGSEGLGALIALSRPAFAFFGHYGSRFGRVEVTTGPTQVYWMAGFEMRRGGACAEEGSVGLLTREDADGAFEYLDGTSLWGFTRHNWQHLPI